MSERWKNYFDIHGAFDEQWLSSAVKHWNFHELLYGTISQQCLKGARILNVGCGPGWSDFYLSALGYEVTGIDNEPDLIHLAQQRANLLNVSTKFEIADAFDLSKYYGKFDLCYSCGVLEHFDREVTVKLLKEQALCANQVLIEIPTKYTAYTGGITDERIYSISELARIVEEAGLNVTVKFGYGDLSATPLHIFLRRVLPRAFWRLLQNKGYAYCIAVVGSRK